MGTAANIVAAPYTGGASLLRSGAGQSLRNTLFGSPPRSGPVEIPGVISRRRGGEFAEQAGSLTAQPISQTLQQLLESNLMRRPQSPYQGAIRNRLLTPDAGPYQGALQNELVNPAQFGGLSESENNLVNQAYSGRQAQFNNLGIGSSPLAQSAIAAAGAPTLASLRQQRVADLMQGQGLYQQQQQSQAQNLLTGQGQFDSQQAQFMQQLQAALQQGLATRGQTLESYLNLARLGQPQVASQTSGGNNPIFAPVQLSAGYSGG